MAGPGTLLVILVTLLLLAGEQMSSLEASYYDFLQRQQPATASDRILLVDTGAAHATRNLWDPDEITPVIDALNAAGASVIVPVEAPPAKTHLPDIEQLAALAQLEQRARQSGSLDDGSIPYLANQLTRLRKQYARQTEIAATVRDAGNIVIPILARPTRQALEDARNDCRRHAVASPHSDVEPWVREAVGTLTLSNVLCDGATDAGFMQYWADDDGIVRRATLLAKSENRIFPSLSLAAAQAGEHAGPVRIEGANRLNVNHAEITTGPGFTSLIRYYGSPSDGDVFETVSSAELLSGDTSGELIRDRIVLIGNLTDGAAVDYRTPFAEHVPMVILLATTVSNLLQSDFIARPAWLGTAELALLLLIGVIILIVAPALSANRAVLSILLLVGVLLATEAYLLIAHGVWVQLVTATLFVVLGIGSVQTFNARRPVAAAAPASEPPGDVRAADDADELDLSFSVLRQQSGTDETKKKLYAIAMSHGKRREFAKAERVLAYIASLDPDYRDVTQKLDALTGARDRKKSEPSAATRQSGDKAATQDTDGSGPRRKLGRYLIESTLGRGAMATVYLGIDPKINRKIAIKTIALAEEFSDSDLDAAKNQFRREAESAGRLNHPNIIAIYDTGEDGNVAYLAMEYFEGTALNQHAVADNLLPAKWVLELTARAAEALHYAHGQGVVHRDIKPANLMYNAATDQLKITDFGIARLTDTSRTKTGIILGTPSFMSPEQLSASSVTGKSDLYSLGITMYQLLTGTTPFRSDSIPKLMDKIMNDKHKPISSSREDIPIEVDMVLDRALAKDPDDRFPNGRAMALALRDCCSTLRT